jgi:hypothetical protein
MGEWKQYTESKRRRPGGSHPEFSGFWASSEPLRHDDDTQAVKLGPSNKHHPIPCLGKSLPTDDPSAPLKRLDILSDSYDPGVTSRVAHGQRFAGWIRTTPERHQLQVGSMAHQGYVRRHLGARIM